MTIMAVSGKLLTAFVLSIYVLGLALTIHATQYEEEKYQENEVRYGRELATLLAQLAHRNEPAICAHKRNSEIINSLLGLPKLLNDAGRK
ncbi:pigment-dispersing hormone peptides [Schistocerca americana]|uniref:Pigment dispersing factor n=1 Tax=Schistocerca gregaria TaxID=7010 RepID=D0VDY8_SCHGR|nr:pigment-dispersing hormone peptides [Schistocerca americana]XP_049810040.1 pigment-dispersing hormone peptides [Schistocerca nitens]XP_049956596.1 pigment-dispersing hormone peptides [Schistocerca serialis cubense]ACY02888.1 pigment dispersing factor precursor [Schistocerca gregaria]UGX04230.1 pigment-dispersing factor [Schistocerca gregaria]